VGKMGRDVRLSGNYSYTVEPCSYGHQRAMKFDPIKRVTVLTG